MEQLQLLLRDTQKSVSLEIISNCQTFTDALRLCKSISGLDDKQIAMSLGIDQGHFSLIWDRNGNKRHFPEAKLLQFMEVCQNKIPLIWLALKCGYTLEPLRNDLEQENEELKRRLADATAREETIVAFLRKTGLRVP